MFNIVWLDSGNTDTQYTFQGAVDTIIDKCGPITLIRAFGTGSIAIYSCYRVNEDDIEAYARIVSYCET